MNTKNVSLAKLAKKLNKPRNFIAHDLFVSDLYSQRIEKNRKAYHRNHKHKNNNYEDM